MAGVLLSVVVPMYNEEEAVAPLVARLRPALDQIGPDYEVIAVDDGSGDGTVDLLRGLATAWPQLTIVRLRRNAGHQPALTAGLRASQGDFVVSIDADLQDPPEKIEEMLTLARQDGLDVVYGVRDDRASDTMFKRLTAGAYYRVMRRLVGSWVPRHAGDFRLLSRAALTTLLALPERQPVYRLLVPSLGFPSGQVTYAREARIAGTTKYPLGKMVRLGLDSITSFSSAPLRLASLAGFVTLALCLLLVVFGLVAFFAGVAVPGWTSVFVAVLLLGAIQLLSIGLLGEYVARLYTAAQNRPSYYITEDAEVPKPTRMSVNV